MGRHRHLFAALGAYSIWGCFPMVLKQLAGYSSLHVLYYRVLLAAAAALLTLPFLHKTIRHNVQLFRSLPARERWQQVLLVLAGGVLLSINWLLYIYTVNNVSIQSASFAYMLCPVLTALLGFIILRETFHTRHWIAVGFAVLSCILLSSESLRNTLSSLCIAFSYAFYLISQKYTGRFNRMFTLTIQLGTGILLIALAFRFAGVTPEVDTFLLQRATLIAVVFTVLPLLLNLYALGGLSSGSVGFLMYLNPLLNFLVAFLVFHEPATSMAWMAYSCMALAVVIYNWSRIMVAK